MNRYVQDLHYYQKSVDYINRWKTLTNSTKLTIHRTKSILSSKQNTKMQMNIHNPRHWLQRWTHRKAVVLPLSLAIAVASSQQADADTSSVAGFDPCTASLAFDHQLTPPITSVVPSLGIASTTEVHEQLWMKWGRNERYYVGRGLSCKNDAWLGARLD